MPKHESFNFGGSKPGRKKEGGADFIEGLLDLSTMGILGAMRETGKSRRKKRKK